MQQVGSKKITGNWVNVYCQEGWKSVNVEDKDSKAEVQLI